MNAQRLAASYAIQSIKMFLIYLFFLSALVIGVMLVSKTIEEKRGKSLFVLRAISRGDEKARYWLEKGLHQYSIRKEKILIFVTKQLPLKSKSYWNKFQSWAKEAGAKYASDLRNSKLLRRSDSEGISEFFKNISEIEKGSGEINEIFEDKESEPISPEEKTQPIIKKGIPRKKKLTVIEIE